jgi:hypothetical protein
MREGGECDGHYEFSSSARGAVFLLGGCIAPYCGTVKIGFVDDRPANITGDHRTEYQTATYTIAKGGVIANVEGTGSLIYDIPEGVVTPYGCTYYRSRTYGSGNTLGTIVVTEAPDHSTASVSLNTWPAVSYGNSRTYPTFKDISPCGIFPEANVIFLTRSLMMSRGTRAPRLSTLAGRSTAVGSEQSPTTAPRDSW